jgi:hypothetical protein
LGLQSHSRLPTEIVDRETGGALQQMASAREI